MGDERGGRIDIDADHHDRLADYDLVRATWHDATNIAHWADLDDVPKWAKTGTFVVTNVGYLVYEDDDCIVLAARVALGGAIPEQVGLFERLPRPIIRDMEVLRRGRPPVRGARDRAPERRSRWSLRRLWRGTDG